MKQPVIFTKWVINYRTNDSIFCNLKHKITPNHYKLTRIFKKFVISNCIESSTKQRNFLTNFLMNYCPSPGYSKIVKP